MGYLRNITAITVQAPLKITCSLFITEQIIYIGKFTSTDFVLLNAFTEVMPLLTYMHHLFPCCRAI